MIKSFGSLAVGAEPNPVTDVRKQAEQALREGGGDILRALKLMLHALPQYELPEVLDNGDIIIRRKHPDRLRYPKSVPRPRDGTRETAG